MSECVLSTSMSPCRGEEEEIYSEQLADKGAERLLSLFFTLYGQGTRLSFHIVVSDEVTARCSQAGFMANSPKAQVGMYHVLAPIMRSCAGRGPRQ